MSYELSNSSKLFLKLNHFNDLNSVQKVCLDNYNSKRDVFVVSKTGTGKTHAYLIPICEHINVVSNKIQVLISVPTRELAFQVYNKAELLRKVYSNLRIMLFSGGDNKLVNDINFSKPPHIIIGTPGKLKALFEANSINLKTIQLLVIDEADMTLEYGFIDDIDYIFSSLIRHSKVMCFSATLKDEAKHFINKYLQNPNIIYIKDKRKEPQITHYLVNSKHKTYKEALINVLSSINPFVCLIFANSKDECNETYAYLVNKGYKALLLHAGLDARDRKKALKDLQDSKYTYVVCSDVASRGLDIDTCSHVISLGFPKKIEFFTHRVGRTGRNGRAGESYTIYNNDDINTINKLKKDGYKFIAKEIKGAGLNDLYIRKYKNKSNDVIEKEIKKIVSKKDKVVKPNYKKKKKLAIEKIKRKAKRDFIKNKIKEQRKERYRQMSRNK